MLSAFPASVVNCHIFSHKLSRMFQDLFCISCYHRKTSTVVSQALLRWINRSMVTRAMDGWEDKVETRNERHSRRGFDVSVDFLCSICLNILFHTRFILAHSSFEPYCKCLTSYHYLYELRLPIGSNGKQAAVIAMTMYRQAHR